MNRAATLLGLPKYILSGSPVLRNFYVPGGEWLSPDSGSKHFEPLPRHDCYLCLN